MSKERRKALEFIEELAGNSQNHPDGGFHAAFLIQGDKDHGKEDEEAAGGGTGDSAD